MGKHTSERWVVIGDHPRDLQVVREDAHHLRVCFLTSDGPTERRARLIAAAPDLLEALKLLVADCQNYEAWAHPCRAVDVALSALSKAEGLAAGGEQVRADAI